MWLFSAMRGSFLRVSFHFAHAILCTGRPAVEIIATMGADRGKLVNFPYWIDIDLNSSRPVRQYIGSCSCLRFVSSGRVINREKGHDCAIRSLAKAFKQVSGVSFEYVIAGTGPDVTEILELAEQLEIGGKVRVLGWLEPTGLVELFANSDVLIHPSPVHEPYGVAVIEAMAAGLVVMASDATCAGIDRIQHGINGFIHRAGDVEDLAKQLRYLFDNLEKIPEISSRARGTAELWSVERAIDILKSVLKIS